MLDIRERELSSLYEEDRIAMALLEFGDVFFRNGIPIDEGHKRAAEFYMASLDAGISLEWSSMLVFEEKFAKVMADVNRALADGLMPQERRSVRKYVHAFLSGSKSAWLNYDDDKLVSAYSKSRLAEIGSVCHSFAERCLTLGWRLEPNDKTVLSFWLMLHDIPAEHFESVLERIYSVVKRYVDAMQDEPIDMSPEVELYYSRYCYGTADCIGYEPGLVCGVPGRLLICDLKTGSEKPAFKQLMIYAALYCLVFDIDPLDTIFTARLYWLDTLETVFEPIEIAGIMEKIRHANSVLSMHYGQ